MVTKNILKQLGQLGQKKYRNQHQLFSVEGEKAILTFLENGYELIHCFGLDLSTSTRIPFEVITSVEMNKLTNLSTSPSFWAAFSIPTDLSYEPQKLNLALDGVRDPGNLGTIIRLCDWFGIKQLLCSTDTVDCYNPKVVQASMGSLSTVQVHYVDLATCFNTHDLVVVGTTVSGISIYDTTLPSNAVLVLGNEGHGISENIAALTSKNVSIPSYGNPAAESLNVAMATGILLSEFCKG